ncbi:MAG TPA: carboxypeptidase-like regulatory domain-containing protein, partial [Chitinophagaceae bacterium]|nr:carboxypeptidase-like regulatory domain-containing protein [Chitinophagaceae bacterium]
MNRNLLAVSFWYKYILTSFLIVFTLSVSAQQTIKGTVSDANSNIGIPGINVIVKNTNRGTITDANGNFQIAASPGEVLQVTAVNYTTREITISSSASVTMSLSPQNTQ